MEPLALIRDLFGIATPISQPPIYDLGDLPPAQQKAVLLNSPQTVQAGWWGGEKYPGGLDSPQLLEIDYYEMRIRSEQLFETNLYARGLINRLITNEINTGLTLDTVPLGSILGMNSEELSIWSEDVETRFSLWGDNKSLCDFYREETFAQLQRKARLMSLISGDVLNVIRENDIGLPALQLIDGAHVVDPIDEDRPDGKTLIIKGIEYDERGRIAAYWVIQETEFTSDGILRSKRIPAFGKRTGRRLAWLQYGTARMMGRNRGAPLMQILLQSLSELDKYRDAESRAAVLNAMLAMSVENTEEVLSTRPLSGLAIQNSDLVATADNGDQRSISFNSHIPGMFIEGMPAGQKIVAHDTSRPNVNFKIFEDALIDSMAWAVELSPSILKLAFNSNYAAARGEINEVIMYLNKIRGDIADQSLKNIYTLWLLDSVIQKRIKAPGLIAAWLDPNKYETLGAWTKSFWRAAIKPSSDLMKDVKAYALMASEGFVTREQAAAELNGSKYANNVMRLKGENVLLAEALEPLLPPEDPDTAGDADDDSSSDRDGNGDGNDEGNKDGNG
jgi:capsid protein